MTWPQIGIASIMAILVSEAYPCWVSLSLGVAWFASLYFEGQAGRKGKE